MNVNVKLAAIEDLSIRKPEEGKTYVVFRDVETDSRTSKYNICVYRAGNWIPEIISDMHWPGFDGIPVTDKDMWINIDDAFASVPVADDAPQEKPVDDTIGVQKDPNNELEGIKKIVEDHERRLQQLERSNTNPLQPAIPAPYPPYTPYTPYPATPGPVWPPEIWYSTGSPYIKPGEITCTYNYVPSKENK